MKRRLVDIYFGFLSKERMTVLPLHVFGGLKQLQRSSMYVSYKVSTFASKELTSTNSCLARYFAHSNPSASTSVLDTLISSGKTSHALTPAHLLQLCSILPLVV